MRVRLSAASRLRHQQAAEKLLPGRRFRNTIHLENGSFRGVSMRGKDETLGWCCQKKLLEAARAAA